MAHIGIMGGTFDPIHNGHLMIGKQAYEEYGLDEIWFMPSGKPPHKTDHRVTEVEDRCKMVQLAISGYAYFRYSDFEIMRAGNSYTAETLRLLSEAYPDDAFFFIIGADSLYEIEQWYHPELVMKRTTLLVAGREYGSASCPMAEQISYLEKKYGAKILRLHSEELDIASSVLRDRIRYKKSIAAFVPPCVMEYITKHGLYQE